MIGCLLLVCALLSFGAGIYILVAWPDDGMWCDVWRFNIIYEVEHENVDDHIDTASATSTTTTSSSGNIYECNYIAYATVEFISSILWLVAAYGPLQFVYSGKLQIHELKLLRQQQGKDMAILRIARRLPSTQLKWV